MVSGGLISLHKGKRTFSKEILSMNLYRHCQLLQLHQHNTEVWSQGILWLGFMGWLGFFQRSHLLILISYNVTNAVQVSNHGTREVQGLGFKCILQYL